MFILPTKEALLEWQIWHYGKRLSMARGDKENKFLSITLKSLLNA